MFIPGKILHSSWYFLTSFHSFGLASLCYFDQKVGTTTTEFMSAKRADGEIGNLPQISSL
jgi:hypothetical protein